MGPPKKTISQQAFDDLVRDNIDDFGMDPLEALNDALQTLTLQGIDLAGIVPCVPGQVSIEDHPVIQSLHKLKTLDSSSNIFNERDLEELTGLLHQLTDSCRAETSANAAIATRNGGLELVTSICSRVAGNVNYSAKVSALRTLALLLHDLQSTEAFQKCGGPDIIVDILNRDNQNLDILNSCFSVVAAAATGNEILKESFMNLKIDELIIHALKNHSKGSIPSLYDALRTLLASDDNRVVASQVYGYARQFAKVGIAGALVDSLREGLSSPSLVSASVALKAVAVNDEICRSVAENGGIDATLRCIDDSGEQGNKTVARACCSLLSKLAGSDLNKSAIVEKGGMERLIRLATRFSDDPSVLQEVMPIFTMLCLRAPEHASRAIEAGAGELAIQAMQKFPAAHQLQRNCCLMIRNLVVRNPENRKILIDNGIEKMIRKAKENNESCKDAATDALRDLGVDNYNA